MCRYYCEEARHGTKNPCHPHARPAGSPLLQLASGPPQTELRDECLILTRGQRRFLGVRAQGYELEMSLALCTCRKCRESSRTGEMRGFVRNVQKTRLWSDFGAFVIVQPPNAFQCDRRHPFVEVVTVP